MIDTPDALDALVAEARAAGAVALDTEFVWERTYFPALGLVQAGLPSGRTALVDPLALSLAPLGALLADPSVVKVLHDAGQDLQILARATGARPVHVFDTQRAAGLVGYSGTLSLQDLVEAIVGVRLDKGETRSDWLARPLSDAQQRYAEDDVRYLLGVHTALQAEAERRGRTAWIADEMARYEADALFEAADPHDAVDRVKARDVGRLNPRQRAVLRALAAWREGEAVALDRTRRMVLPDEALVDLARISPRSLDDLKKSRLSDRQTARFGKGLVAAVEAGLEAPPERTERRGRPGPEEERDAARLLVAQAFVAGRCAREGVDPALVATKTQLKDAVGAGPHAVADLLPGWRGDFLGADLAALLRGELAVRLSADDGWPAVAVS